MLQMQNIKNEKNNKNKKGFKMFAWDYYIIKESRNKFKDWTKAGLEHLRKQYKNLQDEKERKRVKRILDDLSKKTLAQALNGLGYFICGFGIW